eukprot:CAMPEP_0194302476 /NCGR_PEP_ID=MMETSP0171-20130528/264_1 /TAXON_ID=218684 /ORGANISM="Corethron pennatum, Strain L29A3" /LENGTH=211 /DNA_ID=CAMNT_0039052901 /DNA_START=884 /DNA_END=1515 /DNA_ORIENTATION=-
MEKVKRTSVCEMNIQGVTGHLPNSKNDIPLNINVSYMCPKTCGVRKECLCTDSTGTIETPSRFHPKRECSWARDWSAKKLEDFCDESKEPHFARACAITCGISTCAGHESTHSIYLYGNQTKRAISTSCRQIKNSNSTEYMDFMCPQMDYTKNVYTYELCPVTCKAYIPSQVPSDQPSKLDQPSKMPSDLPSKMPSTSAPMTSSPSTSVPT